MCVPVVCFLKSRVDLWNWLGLFQEEESGDINPTVLTNTCLGPHWVCAVAMGDASLWGAHVALSHQSLYCNVDKNLQSSSPERIKLLKVAIRTSKTFQVAGVEIWVLTEKH